MKWLQAPLVARRFAYGRDTRDEIPASNLSGATDRPPGLLQAPVDVTQPPVRVQFMSRRYHASTAVQLPPPADGGDVADDAAGFGFGFGGAGLASVVKAPLADFASGTPWTDVAVVATAMVTVLL